MGERNTDLHSEDNSPEVPSANSGNFDYLAANVGDTGERVGLLLPEQGSGQDGFRFWVSCGTLYFIDPAVFIATAGTQAIPRYRMDKLLDKQDTIRDFEQFKGDNLPGAVQAQRSIFGIDNATGTVFQTMASNPTGSTIEHYNTQRVATSYGEAVNIMNSNT